MFFPQKITLKPKNTWTTHLESHSPHPPAVFSLCLLPVGRHRRSKASGHTMQSRTGTLRPSSGKHSDREIGWTNWLLDDPIPSMGRLYIYLHLVDFYGKCGEIYHTWMVWGWFNWSCEKIRSSNFLICKLVAYFVNDGCLVFLGVAKKNLSLKSNQAFLFLGLKLLNCGNSPEKKGGTQEEKTMCLINYSEILNYLDWDDMVLSVAIKFTHSMHTWILVVASNQ